MPHAVAVPLKQIFRPLADNPLLPLATAATAGILLADRLQPPSWIPFALAAAGIAAGARNRYRTPLMLPILAALTFSALHAFNLERASLFPFAEKLARGAAVSVLAEGVVTQPPPTAADSSSGAPVPCTLRLSWIQTGDTRYALWHPVRVRLPGGPPITNHPGHGDRLRVRGTLRRLALPENPGQFSLANHYRRRGIVGELDVRRPADVQLQPRASAKTLPALALDARAWIERTLTRGLTGSPDTAGVIQAMVLGNRQATSSRLEDIFRHSGSMHIFAVSGLHVGILAFILWHILKTLRFKRAHTVFIIIPVLFFYALITGWRPSAVRAAIMTSVFLVGFAVQRPPRLMNSLAAAALAVLAYDTRQLFLPGFQLSFLVLISIALFATPLQHAISHLFSPDPFLPRSLLTKQQHARLWIGRKTGALVCVSLAAWLGSLPLVLWHFQLVTPVAVLANCILVPLAFVVLAIAVMSLSTAAAGLTYISIAFNNANWLLANILILAGSGFAALPGSHFYVDAPSFADRKPACRVTVLHTRYGGGAQLVELSAVPTESRSSGTNAGSRRRRQAKSGCSVTLPHPGAASQQRRQAPLPVRHRNILIDTGNRNAYYDVVRPCLRLRRAEPLDAFVVSHGDVDHFGGAGLLIEEFNPRLTCKSPLKNRSPYYGELLLALESQSLPLQTVTTGHDLITLPPRLNPNLNLNPTPDNDPDPTRSSLTVLFPPAGMHENYAADNQCLVLRLQTHGWRILFMNDCGFSTEKWLLENLDADSLKSHVVIKGRHASDFSGLAGFMNAVRPAAVISTNARYPETEAIPPAWRDMLARKNIVLFDQSKTGAVEILCHPGRLELRGYVNKQTLVLK